MAEEFPEQKPSELEMLRAKEQELRTRHEEMLRIREQFPNDSELRVNADKLYDEWSEVKRRLTQLESGE